MTGPPPLAIAPFDVGQVTIAPFTDAGVKRIVALPAAEQITRDV
jgi:hypothetical protein